MHVPASIVTLEKNIWQFQKASGFQFNSIYSMSRQMIQLGNIIVPSLVSTEERSIMVGFGNMLRSVDSISVPTSQEAHTSRSCINNLDAAGGRVMSGGGVYMKDRGTKL